MSWAPWPWAVSTGAARPIHLDGSDVRLPDPLPSTRSACPRRRRRAFCRNPSSPWAHSLAGARRGGAGDARSRALSVPLMLLLERVRRLRGSGFRGFWRPAPRLGVVGLALAAAAAPVRATADSGRSCAIESSTTTLLRYRRLRRLAAAAAACLPAAGAAIVSTGLHPTLRAAARRAFPRRLPRRRIGILFAGNRGSARDESPAENDRRPVARRC